MMAAHTDMLCSFSSFKGASLSPYKLTGATSQFPLISNKQMGFGLESLKLTAPLIGDYLQVPKW